MIEGEITDVSIDKKTQFFAKTAKSDEEITIKANANIGEGTEVELNIVTFLKGLNEPKVCSYQEYVKNNKINKMFTMQEIATMLSVDANEIKDIQASIKHEDVEYKSNTTNIQRTLKSKLYKEDKVLNDIVEDKEKKVFKKTTPTTKGDEVKLIQQALQKMKIDIGDDGVDGKFGNDADNAVMTFQENYKPTHNIHQYTWSKPDGVVGKNTILAMDEALVEGWRYIKNGTWDNITDDRIKKLHPKIRKKAENFINNVEKELKIKLRVTQGLRTVGEQNNLYKKGRTTAGEKVTWVKGGYSFHNYGLAIDIVEIKDGKLNWNLNWKDVSRIGKQCGFEWGGDWKSFKDKPHFQYRFEYTIKEIKNKYENNKKENGYVKI
jgi:peptidoglycan L-alanyl-D-glutamate endopeptidase CwlK